MLPSIEAMSPKKKESTMNFFSKSKGDEDNVLYGKDGKPLTPRA